MADAAFLRDVRSDERGEWRLRPGMPPRWTVAYEYKDMALRMRLGLTSFKHVGIFPEQAANWNFIYDNCRALVSGGTFPADISGAAAAGSSLPAHDVAVPSGAGIGPDGHSATGPGGRVTPRVLNLFAYTGRGEPRCACRRGGYDACRFGEAGGHLGAREYGTERTGRHPVGSSRMREIRAARNPPWQPLPRHRPRSPGLRAGCQRREMDSRGQHLRDARVLCPVAGAAGAFLVLNLYSMGLSSTLARTAVLQAFGAPRTEQYGELCFTDRAGKQLPLGTYYRFTR